LPVRSGTQSAGTAQRRQKRPSIEAKKTYYKGNRDPH
jgi:hypothetical protein